MGRSHRALLWLLAFACPLNGAGAALGVEGLQSLRVLQQEYPRAYFFRSSEGWAASERVAYDRWEACFSRLKGIEGKVLEEEVPGRSLRNIDFFTRFKKEHPEQLVLLHYNGNARDPRYETQDSSAGTPEYSAGTQKYFAGHFLYFNGAKILDDVPAEAGETEIRVDKSYRYVVEYLRGKATIRAVIGMPESLFKTSGKGGTHTKTCLLVAVKEQFAQRDHKIFMAEARWCGKDSRAPRPVWRACVRGLFVGQHRGRSGETGLRGW